MSCVEFSRYRRYMRTRGSEKMKILFFFVHPGAFHVLKRSMEQLKREGHSVEVAIINKDVLPELLRENGVAFTDIFPEGRHGRNLWDAGCNLMKTVWRLRKLIGRKHYDCFVTDDCLSINGYFSKTPTLFLIDDDLDVVPEIAPLLFCATEILAPDVTRLGRFEKKKKGFSGYKELSYLHPAIFTPDPAVATRYGLEPRKYIFVRVVGLTATHDRHKRGIDDIQLSRIVDCATGFGYRVVISAERKLPPELELYRIQFAATDGLHLLAHAALFVGDSQTMTSEAALLGIPALRCNDFVGKISVMEEKETRYGLTFGYRPENSDSLLNKLKELLSDPQRQQKWSARHRKMLNDAVDISELLVEEVKKLGER